MNSQSPNSPVCFCVRQPRQRSVLVTGKYYRFNVTSSGETDWRLELPELLAKLVDDTDTEHLACETTSKFTR